MSTETWPIPWQPVVGDRGGAFAWVEAQAARAALHALGKLPLALQDAFAAGASRAALRLDRRHSAAARGFLRQAYGTGLSDAEVERRVREAWRFFLTTLLRGVRMDEIVRRDGFGAHFDAVYADGVREALEVPRGKLLVTPHLGDFEAGAFGVSHFGFAPVYVVSRPPRNKFLSIAAQESREERGYRLLHRHGAMEDVARILGANGTLVLMLDQRARRRTVVAPFFGRLAHCERAPAILMRRLSVPVVTAWCQALPEPWRYRFHFTRVLEPKEFARASPEEISTALNKEMEQMILSAPEQYFWFHDRYRKAPKSP